MATRGEVLKASITLDTKKARTEASKFGKTIDGVASKGKSKLGALAPAFGGVAVAVGAVTLAVGAAVAAVAGLDKFFAAQEKLVGLERGFRTLTGRIGETSTSMLTALRPATQGLISDMDLMQSSNQAILLGLPVTSESMSEMAGRAVLLGKAMGINAGQAIESVTVGIGRQSKLWLDNLGIIIDVEKVNNNLAAQLGVTTSELTDQQKKVGFFNSTMVAMREATAGLEIASTDLASVWAILRTGASNLAADFLGLGSDSVELRDGFIDLSVGVLETALVVETALKVWLKFDPVFGTIVTTLKVVRVSFNAVSDAVSFWGNKVDEAKAGISRATRGMITFDTSAKEATEDVSTFSAGIQEMIDSLKAARSTAEGTDLVEAANAVVPLEVLPPDFEPIKKSLLQGLDTDTPFDIPQFDIAGDGGQFDKISETVLANAQALQEALANLTNENSDLRLENEISKIGAHYDLQRELAEELGIDLANIDAAKEAEIAAVRTDFALRQSELDDAVKQNAIDNAFAIANAAVGFAKAAFGDIKAVRIAEAIVNTAKGITEAGANLPLAALIAATGAVQIAKIASTNPGSGSSIGGGVATGGGAPVGALGGGAAGGAQAPPQQVTIFIDGSAVFAATPEDLVRAIAEPLRNELGTAGAEIEVFT